MKRMILPITLLAVMTSTGCMYATTPSKDNTNPSLTVGAVQREVVKGMPAADVIAILGSPNIVKKSANGGETWVYDRFSTEEVYETVAGGLGFGSGDVGIAVGSKGGKRKTSSHSLTVILNFDDADNVESIAYHRSKF